MNFGRLVISVCAVFCLLFSCQKTNEVLDVKAYYDQIRDASHSAADSLIQTINVDALNGEDQKWFDLLKLMVRGKKDSTCLMHEFEKVMQDETYSSLVKQENFQFILSNTLSGKCKDWQKDLLESFLNCLLYTSPSPRDRQKSRMPSSA